jgi:hypothetical protein
MADNQFNKANNSSDEIDLGQFVQFLGNGLDKLFQGFLRFFLFLKNYILILVGLSILGIAIGYGLNQIISKKLKTEIIVMPNMESKNYLYDVVDEIQANILAENYAFFETLGIEATNLKQYEISVAPVDDKATNSEEELKYLEILQNFENTDAIADIVRAELQNNNSFNHRITILYRDNEKGQKFAEKIMEYINTNEYFDKIIQVYRENALERIAANKVLLGQIDEIITNYSKKIADEQTFQAGEKIILDNQERINTTGLFELKNQLIRDIEAKKIELTERTEPIRIINFGKTQEVVKPFFGKNIILIPTILIGLFFVFFLIIYLDKKAKELQ